jgi:uncharacterized phage protein gp47/JayE
MLPSQPTLTELKARMLADLDYRLPSLRTRPAKAVLVVLVTVIAGVISSLYAFAGWIAQQLDPLTASESWLAVWASRLGVPRKSATASAGKILLTGSGAIPSGTRLRHVNSGALYQTTASGNAGEAIPATAETTGAITNLAVTETLTLETPISGIGMTATIAVAFAGGADIEPIPAWAARVAEKLQDRQKIGDNDDYKRWAKESHANIIDAQVYGNTPQLGSILIRVLGTATNPIIDAVTLAAAQAVLDRKRNVGCTVTLAAAIAQPIAIRIADVPETARPAIATGITSLFSSRAKFNAQLWPEELERIIALHSDTYTLLAPVGKVTATDGKILTQEAIAWL